MIGVSLCRTDSSPQGENHTFDDIFANYKWISNCDIPKFSVQYSPQTQGDHWAVRPSSYATELKQSKNPNFKVKRKVFWFRKGVHKQDAPLTVAF
jgi:hypothetical protein